MTFPTWGDILNQVSHTRKPPPIHAAAAGENDDKASFKNPPAGVLDTANVLFVLLLGAEVRHLVKSSQDFAGEIPLAKRLNVVPGICGNEMPVEIGKDMREIVIDDEISIVARR